MQLVSLKITSEISGQSDLRKYVLPFRNFPNDLLGRHAFIHFQPFCQSGKLN